MRRASKRDANEPEIIKALRKMGVSVSQIDSATGVPDLILGFNGNNYLVEVKDGNKSPSRRKLTPEQVKWHDNWQGTAHVIETVDQAIELVNRERVK